MKRALMIATVVLMFMSFVVSGLFLLSSPAFDEDGEFDLESGLEVLEELDRLPFVRIDVESLRAEAEAEMDKIVDFVSCEEAGYPVMESYPRQCRDLSGRVFVEDFDGFLK